MEGIEETIAVLLLSHVGRVILGASTIASLALFTAAGASMVTFHQAAKTPGVVQGEYTITEAPPGITWCPTGESQSVVAQRNTGSWITRLPLPGCKDGAGKVQPMWRVMRPPPVPAPV